MKEKLPSEMPVIGKIKDDTLVLGMSDGIEYKLHRYRHHLEKERFSIHLRFKETNDHLIRIDINNGSHRNPDGEIISNNHIHIYKDSEYAKDAFAYPLPTEFTDLESIFSVLEQFLLYTNIQEDPN
ncbi:hypothetical protein FUT28_10485 [Enterococcus durans]|nr:hypothetical protein [Enterococcus durans]QED60283.1 hypothetical protein FS851_10780 [Enterococcus durans]QED62834.1 hypothetical protein FUT28_10485 [Enterococcus durans]